MSQPPKTNWDSYYHTPYRFSWLTRHFTNRALAKSIRRHLSSQQPIRIIELGGGGSAFYEWLQDQFHPQQYIVVDNNQTGLEKLSHVAAMNGHLVLMNSDIMKPISEDIARGEVVFSVGLIEHFLPDVTERVLAAHFEWATPNGLVVIVYPTPTWLYRLSRLLSEKMGWWIFHDEIPLKLDRVEQLLRPYGQILEHRIHWFNPFTQAIVVAKRFRDEV